MINLSLKYQRCAKCKTWKKWQLFRATDFQSLMYPCFTFCSVLGIFPYKINGLTFEISKRRYILSSVIICLLCINELIVLYKMDIAGTIYHGNVPNTLEHTCFHILGNFIALVTYILSGPRMRLLQTIMNVAAKLPPNSYKKLSKLIHTKDIFGFFVLATMEIWYCYNLDFATWYKAFVPYMILVVFQMDMLYMNCVCILKASFQNIDDNLINLRELVVNDESHPLRQTYHDRKNRLLLMKLKALKKQHLAISDTVQMLNTIFNLQILATIIMTFAVLTFHLYLHILHWKTGQTLTNLGDMLFDLFSTITIIYYSIKILLIIWACETGKDRAMNIGYTVHDLLNNISDKQIKDKLQLFSLQILHRKNAFSAKGVIVDITLLIAIVANITTYLLILIQDLIATYLCNGKK